ncbi:nicotinate phosphoribosyltransferase [Synechococcus sp. PCC 7336]|uniref:nicotinate phosphoribosyltransferase n=1 Tax=Synechococcus sp. PCC 7336 TaxID=195250 RepID=UPI0004772B02
MKYNFLLDTDSYKVSHWLQYPPGTEGMFSYVESRGGRYPATLFFGLQYILKHDLAHPVEAWMVEEAKEFYTAHGEPFNEAGWNYIVRELGGKLPIRIRAVPEGTVVPVHNVLMTVESTDPQVFWLVSWLETLLLRVWYPVTVATQSWYLRQAIYDALVRTADNPDGEIGFKLHDFGARGVSSCESSGIGGMAHLVSFSGSDTVQGVAYANHYYHHPMAGFSIPAAEHSTMTAWGRSREEAAYRNMLEQFAKPGSSVAVVSDSYDIWHAVENLWGGSLRQEVLDSGATVVIRPDSGNPAVVVSRILKILDDRFGSTTNSKGYKVLNAVRVIQGDGMNPETIVEVLEAIAKLGFSASNIAFGMGGALLQQVNRDTQKFAYKCSLVRIDGKDIPVLKDPATDPGKRSKPGRLDLVEHNGEFQTIVLPVANPSRESQLETVYENGKIVREYSLERVRQRAGAR